MMPTSGTIRGERSGICRRIIRKSVVPASAKTVATSILRPSDAPGASRVMTRIPRLADSAVPAVVGETNRLRASICMIMPAMLIDMPTRMIAIVRGTRDTTNTIADSKSSSRAMSDENERS